jgi:hypothetical protein
MSKALRLDVVCRCPDSSTVCENSFALRRAVRFRDQFTVSRIAQRPRLHSTRLHLPLRRLQHQYPSQSNPAAAGGRPRAAVAAALHRRLSAIKYEDRRRSEIGPAELTLFASLDARGRPVPRLRCRSVASPAGKLFDSVAA